MHTWIHTHLPTQSKILSQRMNPAPESSYFKGMCAKVSSMMAVVKHFEGKDDSVKKNTDISLSKIKRYRSALNSGNSTWFCLATCILEDEAQKVVGTAVGMCSVFCLL